MAEEEKRPVFLLTEKEGMSFRGTLLESWDFVNSYNKNNTGYRVLRDSDGIEYTIWGFAEFNKQMKAERVGVGDLFGVRYTGKEARGKLNVHTCVLKKLSNGDPKSTGSPSPDELPF